MSSSASVRAAAVLCGIDALGFGLPCVGAIRNLALGRDVPVIMGFPAYGGGPFEHLGIRSTVPLVSGFLLVCVLEGAAGWLLWRGRRGGAVLAIALLPAGAVYWWGFDLPIPPLFALARTALIGMSWRRLE